MNKNKGALVTNLVIDQELVEVNVIKRFKRFFFVKPKITSANLIYVPCWQIKMKYENPLLVGKIRKKGTLFIIVDEKFGISCLEKDELVLKTESLKESMLPFENTEEQVIDRAKKNARWKVLYGRYRTIADLEIVKVTRFYRPYWDLSLEHIGKNSKQLLAADGYATQRAYSTRTKH